MRRWYSRIEDGLVVVTFTAMVLLLVASILFRILSGGGLEFAEVTLGHLTLWTTLLASIVTTRERKHISFGLSAGRVHHGAVVPVVLGVFQAGITTALAISGLSFIVLGFDPAGSVGLVPIRVATVVIPIAFLAISARFIEGAGLPLLQTTLLALGSLFAGILISLPAIYNLLLYSWADAPLWLDSILDSYFTIAQFADLPMVLLLIVLTILGMPIFLLLGGAALFLFAGSYSSPEIVSNELYNLLTDPIIPSVPLFTMAGFILSSGGSGERLVALLKSVMRRLPGGLAIMAVAISTFFTTFTGASGVTILALGGVLAYILESSGGYSRKFTHGLLTSSGSLGVMFPPSLPIIMYSIAAQVSVRDMFVGSLLPGILIVSSVAILGIIHNLRRTPSQSVEPSQEDSETPALKILGRAAGDIMLPVVVLLLYFGGITTLVETSAVAVVYVLLLEGAVFRALSMEKLKEIFRKATPVIGGVLIILAMAKGLSYFLIDAGIPSMMTAFLKDRVTSPVMFLLLLNMTLLITGCLMDIYSAILVVAPLVIPMAEVYGINPVHLGVVFLANLQLGYLTPPVGLNLFLASYTFNSPITSISRGITPFFLVMLGVVLLISFIPSISLLFL